MDYLRRVPAAFPPLRRVRLGTAALLVGLLLVSGGLAAGAEDSSAPPAGTAPVEDAAPAATAPEASQPAARPDQGSAPNQADAGVEKVVPGNTARPMENGERKLRFNFRYQPWDEVLDWFAEQADLSLVMDHAPKGTFNYTDSRSYTPAEAIDLLNSVLLTKGYTLVRRDRMLMVINLEDGIPPNLVPYVPLEKLHEKGEFELVSVLFRLERMTPAEAEQEIQKLLGPQGSVVVLPKAGQVQVTETAGRIRMIRSVIEAIETPTGPANEKLQVFELKHALLDDVLGVMRQLLGIAEDSLAASDGSVRIATDPTTGKLLVTGKPEMIARVEQILNVVDVPAGTGPEAPLAVETPQLEVHPVTAADPTAVLQVLQTILANNPEVRLAVDPKTGHLVALARPSQHATIRATIAQMQRDARKVEVIPLNRIDPQVAVLSINKLFGDGQEAGSLGPKVDADPHSRQLLVRGSDAQIAQIRNLLEQMGATAGMDSSVGSSSGNVRMVPVSERTARLALEQIEQLWPSLRQNKIRVVTPSAVVPTYRTVEPQRPAAPPGSGLDLDPAEPVLPRPADGQPPAGEQPTAQTPDIEGQRPSTAGARIRRAVLINAPQAGGEEPAERNQAAGEPAGPAAAAAKERGEATGQGDEAGRSAAPIVVAPGPGGVMIASEDIEALDEFEALLSALAGPASAGGPEFTVFYLANASAASVAESLGQILGSASSGSVSSSPETTGGNLGGAIGALLNLGTAGAAASAGPVSIIPDARLNALIVQASPADVDTIEQLLKVLDQPEVPETQVAPKPRMIAVMNTSAAQIAEIVKEVYQDRLVSANRQRQPSPEEFFQAMRGGGRPPGRRSDTPEGPKVSIGVDSRTNSLIVAAPQPLFEEIRLLVETLDQATSESNTAVRVVALRRSNPDTVQKALAAMVGDKVRTSRTGETSSASAGTPPGSSGERPPDQDFQERMRRQIEFFNRMRESGGFGGSREGGSGGFSPRDGGRGGFEFRGRSGSGFPSRGSGQ